MNPFVTIITGDSAAEQAFAAALKAKLAKDFGDVVTETVEPAGKPVKKMTKFTASIIPRALIAQMQANRLSSERDEHDPKPVVHLYVPGSNSQWLLTEIDEDLDIAFGLCDLGVGLPEMGYASLHRVLERTPWAMINLGFVGIAPLSEYAERARDGNRIVISWEGMPDA